MVQRVRRDSKNLHLAGKVPLSFPDAVLAQKQSIESKSAALGFLNKMVPLDCDKSVRADSWTQQPLAQVPQPRVLAATDRFNGS